MAGQSNRRPGAAIRAVVVSAGDWVSGPLLVARTARQRRRGVRPLVGPFGVLLATRSIHSWGLAAPLRWVGIDRTGTLIAAGTLRPRRIALAPRGVYWIVEMPLGVETPAIGGQARVIPILAAWPDD